MAADSRVAVPESSRIRTAITRLLDIDHPILLAPMGGIAGGALAGAVSAAGGLGLIGAGYADPSFGYGSADWIGSEFDKAGGQSVGIGFITWALDQRPGALDAALERQPRAVMLSFGDIAPYASKIRDAGAILICQVQSLKDARDAVTEGAQIIVAQGTEAGGHTLRTSVFDTARGLTWPRPYTGRAIRNAFTETWHGHDDELRSEGPTMRERLFAASRDGDTETAVTYAGEGLDLIDDRPAAGELVGRIIDEAIHALTATAAMLATD